MDKELICKRFMDFVESVKNNPDFNFNDLEGEVHEKAEEASIFANMVLSNVDKDKVDMVGNVLSALLDSTRQAVLLNFVSAMVNGEVDNNE